MYGPEQPPDEARRPQADLYAVLGVSAAADRAAITSAFRALIKQHHPDLTRDQSSARAEQIVSAYRTLADPAARARYDAGLGCPRLAPPAAGGFRRPRRSYKAPSFVALTLLAASGAIAAMLHPAADDSRDDHRVGGAAGALRSPATDRSGSTRPDAPTGEWLRGAWVRENSPCTRDSVTVFHADKTWAAADSHGRWRIDENKLHLEPVEGAVPAGADSPWHIERIVTVAPNEFRTFSGQHRVQRTFDRCREIG